MNTNMKILAAMLLYGTTVETVQAHAHLTTAIPEPNGTVSASPAQVNIKYTEDLEAKLSSIKIEDASGVEVDTGNSHLDPKDAKRLTVDLKPLRPGTYKVTWRVTATDTHTTNGTYTFTVTK